MQSRRPFGFGGIKERSLQNITIGKRTPSVRDGLNRGVREVPIILPIGLIETQLLGDSVGELVTGKLWPRIRLAGLFFWRKQSQSLSLQSLRSLAAGGRLAAILNVLPGAHDAAMKTVDGPPKRWVDQQDACVRRYKWLPVYRRLQGCNPTSISSCSKFN
jgi:hypothetical protein